MTLVDGRAAGIYWQSRMGNNPDGIGGNCHCYDVVTGIGGGAPAHRRFLVDFGIKLGGSRSGYSCEFPSPDGLLAGHQTGRVDGGGQAPDGVLLTHAHEDHLGAIHHAIDMGFQIPPVYASPFTATSLVNSLVNAGIDRGRWPSISMVKAGETVSIANAQVEFVPMDHMPGATAFRIRTSEATVFHTGDYKFDSTLTLGDRANPRRLRQIGKEGVDVVVSDSTSAGMPGEPVSEEQIRRALTRVVADNRGRAVVAAILGTQLDRLASLAEAARANGRSVVVSGRSLVDNVHALASTAVDIEAITGARLLTTAEARTMPADRVLVVTTGAFAQPQAGLMRAAQHLPGALCVDGDTTVIIPQRAIPNIEHAHARMVADLEARGAWVITAERAADMGYGPIHQSGHAIERDSRLLYTLVSPKHVIVPVHGNAEQVEANARIADSLGIATLPFDRNGAVVRVTHDGVDVIGYEDVKRIGARQIEGEVKALPRSPRGQGRGSRPPPQAYCYDELDAQGRTVLVADVHPLDTPTRPAPQARAAAARAANRRHAHAR